MTMAGEPCLCRSPLARIYRSCPQHGQVGDEYFALKDANARAVAERNRWVQLFNQLERHVSRHSETKGGTGFCDDADDVLHRGWQQVMKAAQEPLLDHAGTPGSEPRGEAPKQDHSGGRGTDG